MFIKKGLGAAFDKDPYNAGLKAAGRALDQNNDPQAAILFASSSLDSGLVLKGAGSVLGNIPVFGSSSYFEMSNSGLESGSVVILLLSSDVIDFNVRFKDCGKDPYKAAKAISSGYAKNASLSENDAVTCLITGTELHFKGSRYLDAIADSFPFPIPVTGGGSAGIYGDDLNFEFFNGRQFCGGEAVSNNVSMLFMKTAGTENIRFGYASESSWSPIAKAVKCSGAKGNLVYEVDGGPIHDYLETYLGEDFANSLNTTSYKYSFIEILKDGETLKHIIRTPGNFDPKTGAIEFFPNEDMLGKTIQLVQLGRDEMLEGVKKAAVNAKCALAGFEPEAVFVFSCHLRHRVLHSRTGEEIAAVKKVFGENVPVIGCYCAGEYGPLYERYEDITNAEKALSGSKQLSTSISIMVIGSRPDQAEKIEVNYYKKLCEYKKADKKGETPAAALKRRIRENESMLKKAERIISETEKAFKNINSEHYRLTVELQKKNAELFEANEKNEKLQEIIKKYTPHTVWKKARKTVEAGNYEIPDEELFSVLMFIDVKGFTSYAEKHAPADVIKAINEIFDPLTDIVYSNGGDIDKFIGDCIFAVFATEDAAFSTAVSAQRFMKAQRSDHFKIRIGINGGRVISGNVGGCERRDNTLIGDAVNLAQRLESNCEPGTVLISEAAFEKIDRKLLKGFNIIKKSVEVKGKERPVKAVGVII